MAATTTTVGARRDGWQTRSRCDRVGARRLLPDETGAAAVSLGVQGRVRLGKFERVAGVGGREGDRGARCGIPGRAQGKELLVVERQMSAGSGGLMGSSNEPEFFMQNYCDAVRTGSVEANGFPMLDGDIMRILPLRKNYDGSTSRTMQHSRCAWRQQKKNAEFHRRKLGDGRGSTGEGRVTRAAPLVKLDFAVWEQRAREASEN